MCVGVGGISERECGSLQLDPFRKVERDGVGKHFRDEKKKKSIILYEAVRK